MPVPEGVLLGPPEPVEGEELEALRRRHAAAMRLVFRTRSAEQRIELLLAVVAPSDDFLERVRLLEAAE